MRRIFGVFAALSISAAALGQEYPSKPVKIVLPYPPGGPGDFISRTVGEKLQQKFGQPFLVEPRPGANLRIATEYLAKSAPDGHSIAFIGVPHATNPTFYHRAQPEDVTETQLHIYALGYQELTGRTADFVEIYNLDEGKGKPRSVDDEFIDDVKKQVRGAAHALRTGNLPPTPAPKKCGACDYKRMCSSAK